MNRVAAFAAFGRLRTCVKAPALSSFVSIRDRGYSRTSIALEDEATAAADAAAAAKQEKAQLRAVANEYQRQRALYKRQVSELRSEYLKEYRESKKQDKAAKEQATAEATRKRLERQRGKNIRSAQNAMRQEELRRLSQISFEEHLQKEQVKREAKKALFTKARQLVIDELEEEAPMWLTTPEEVDAAFTDDSEQLLWSRPGGYVGVPEPSLDSSFWQYEVHTWRVEKTYRTRREILLEKIEERIYDKTNIDPLFWTPERLAEQEAVEEKAKLRAMVRMYGRRSLLKRMNEYQAESTRTEKGEPPKPLPVPNLRVLADTEALEREGAILLFKDPTQFFVFDRSAGGHTSHQDETDADSAIGASATSSTQDTKSAYGGHGMGVPISLRDPLRENSVLGEVFPEIIAKIPKPDTRTEKEKKRESRQQKLLAAANAENDSFLEDDTPRALDYDAVDDVDSDDEEWLKNLDPDLEKSLADTPPQLRFNEDDINWVKEELAKKAERRKVRVKSELANLQLELDRKAANGELAVQEGPVDLGSRDVRKLEAADIDPQKFDEVMSSLTQEQLIALFKIGANSLDDDDNEEGGGIDIAEALRSVPGLSDEQFKALLEMESALKQQEEASTEI